MISFEEVYSQTADLSYNVAWRMLGNSHDAEEVVQEVFIAVHNKLRDFRFESSVKTWVYRITVNRAINFSKKRSREKMINKEYENELRSSRSPAAGNKNVPEPPDELLKVLDEDQKACLVLRSIEGLSYKEIARTLKININTVRSRLSRARERLLALRKARMA